VPGRLEHLATLALEGGRVDDEFDHPAHEPWAVASNRHGDLGGVLFVLREGADERYRSLLALYERSSNGEWDEISLSGAGWSGDPSRRPPPVPEDPLARLLGLAESGGEDGWVYLLGGRAAAGVTEVVPLGLDGPSVPVSKHSGAFLAMGSMSAEGRPPDLQVRLGDRREVLSVSRSGPDPSPAAPRIVKFEG
jgi:hypothetical protein